MNEICGKRHPSGKWICQMKKHSKSDRHTFFGLTGNIIQWYDLLTISELKDIEMMALKSTPGDMREFQNDKNEWSVNIVVEKNLPGSGVATILFVRNIDNNGENDAIFYSNARDLVLRLVKELSLTKIALSESVKLQSHYAALLNAHDDGKRLEYSVDTWIDRITAGT